MKHTVNERKVALYKYLINNFTSGKFFSIEEIVANVHFDDGEPCYYLNTDPYNHDKCAVLSSDVRSWNWSTSIGQLIMVKDSKGGVKLCESPEEFESWRKKELEPIEKKCKYLNSIKYAVTIDSSVDLITGEPVNTLYK